MRFIIYSLLILFFCTKPGSAQNPTAFSEIKNPLPECPSSPNCERREILFQTDSAMVKNAADSVLREMNAHEISWNVDNQQIDAVFKIPIFGFLDDVAIAVRSNGNQSHLFIRSASREGYSDLGVNKRRVNKFLRLIQQHLP